MLKYYGSWNFHEAYSLPTQIRRWFIKRLIKEKEREKQAREEARSKSKSSHTPYPAIGQMKRK
jgi:hypothetical protein